MQAALLGMQAGVAVTPLPWRADGGVRVLRAQSRLAAAQWFAADDPGDFDRVVIAARDSAALDAALGAQDRPLLGLAEPSIFRPTLQLLPLVARLMWDPLDFRALLQFLTLPVGPLRSFARRRLAEKMVGTPGIGGTAWEAVKREIAAHYAGDAAAVLEDIEFWFEHPRFTSGEGMPLGFFAERVERLAAFFKKGIASDDRGRRTASASAYSQAQALGSSIQTLLRQGLIRIGPEALDRLVSQADTAGVDNPELQAQAGAACRVRDPGALIEAFDEVCWWNLLAEPLPHPYPWSPCELRELHAVGVDLPDIARLLERQVHGWVRALMLPRPGEETHPAWLMISALLIRPPIESVEDRLSTDQTTSRITVVPHRALPALRRWISGRLHTRRS